MKLIAHIHERVTERSVSLLPEDHWAAQDFTLVVRKQRPGVWSVEWPGHGVLNQQTREFEPERPGDRDDGGWLALHHFDGGKAMKLACAIAPELRLGDLTVRQALILKRRPDEQA